MIKYLSAFVLIIAIFHAYTYAVWLRQHKNTIGAAGVYITIATGIAITTYHLLSTR